MSRTATYDGVLSSRFSVLRRSHEPATENRELRTENGVRGSRFSVLRRGGNPEPPTENREPRTENRSQAGFTLAALVVILTILAIMIAYTVPRMWSKVLQRDRDRQTLFVMKQYTRAILEFQKRHGGLPTSLDQIKQARTPRLIRGVNGEWVDPMTGKVDWILVPPTALSNPAITNITDPNPQNKNYPGPTGTAGATGTTGTAATGTGGVQAQPGKNPADYTGPFVGVRPNFTGKSYLLVHGSENYEDWIYTTQDLTNDINAQILGNNAPGVIGPAGGNMPGGTTTGGRVQPTQPSTPKP